MNNQMVRWIGSVALLLGFAVLFTQCNKTEQVEPSTTDGILVAGREAAANPGDPCSCLAANFGPASLSDEEIAALAFMREEEKMARDVYLNLYEKWNVRIFSNIARSEQRHMDAILCLLERYGLEDPTDGQPAGSFQNAALQELYDGLMAQGEESLVAALTVGATIEDVDILDLQQNLDDAAIDNDDIQAVFNNLARGSRNHLRAFTRELEKLGASYEVQYISEADYDAILSSGPERGEGLCGNGPRLGQGNGQGNGSCDGNGPHGNQGNGNHCGNCPNNGNGAGNGSGNCDGNGPHGNQGGNGNGNGNNNGTGNNGPGNGNGGNNGGGNNGPGNGNGGRGQ